MEKLTPLLCVHKNETTASIRLAFLRIKTENKGTIAHPVTSRTISWPEAVTSCRLNIHLTLKKEKKKKNNGATERRKVIRRVSLLKVKLEVKGKRTGLSCRMHTQTDRKRLSGQRIKAHGTAHTLCCC